MFRDIPIGEIRPNPRQPRKHFAGLEELAQSLTDKGQLTPALVRPVATGFELVHGERRWRAAQLAGLSTLRCEVRELDDTEAYRLSVIENLQREQLTPIEEAEAFKALQAGGMKQGEVGALVGKTQSYVATKLRLLTLPIEMQEAIDAGTLSEGQAKQILRVDDLSSQIGLFKEAQERDLSVKAVKAEADRLVSYLEAQAAISLRDRLALAENSVQKPVSDHDLLLACRCDIPWNDYWPAEDFRRCANRRFGIFARFLYWYSVQGDPIASYGWSRSGENVDLYLACEAMRRQVVSDNSNAAILFVNFPARCDHQEIAKSVSQIARKVDDDCAVIIRCGAEELEAPEVTASGDFSAVLGAFQSHKFNGQVLVVATLAELPLADELVDRLLDGRPCKTVIACYESWLVVTRAGHYLEGWPRGANPSEYVT